MKTSAGAGTIDLRDSYRKNLKSGLLAAASIHIMIFGALLLNSREIEQNVRATVCVFTPYNNTVRFDSYMPRPTIEPKISLNNNSFGIPIPIPDPEFNPERILTAMDQSGSYNGTVTGTDFGSGTVEHGGSGTGDEDVRPEEFTPGVEKYPMILMNPSPQYPDLARRAGIEGTVYVKMWVAKDGTVKSSEVVKSSSEIFDQAALDASKKWLFTPAIMNNKPVSVFVTVPFKFRLSAS